MPLKSVAPETVAACRDLFAAQGLDAETELSRDPGDLQRQELFAARNGLRKVLAELNRRGKASANGSLSEPDQAAWDAVVAQASEITNELDDREARGDWRPSNELIPGVARRQGLAELPGAPRMNGDRSRDPMAPLAAGERAVDRVAALTGESADMPPIGDLVRAEVTGDWTGLREFRAQQSVGTGGSGGFITPRMMGARVIDLARAQARVVQAGASVIPMASSGATFATVEQDPTANWRAENAEIPESELMFGERSFKPHSVAILVRASLELIEDAANASPIIENAIAQQIALAMDKAALFGTGMGEPLGLYNTDEAPYAVNFVDVNGPLTSYAPLSQAVQKVAENNLEAGDFILAARTAGELDRLTDSENNPLQPPRSVASRNLWSSNQVRTDLWATDATGSPEIQVSTGTAIFTGLWSDYYLLSRTDLVLEASRVAGDAFKKAQVLIRGFARIDGFAVRPKSFCVIRNITPAG